MKPVKTRRTLKGQKIYMPAGKRPSDKEVMDELTHLQSAEQVASVAEHPDIREMLRSIRSWLVINDDRCVRYEKELKEQRALLEEVKAGVRLILRHVGRQLLVETDKLLSAAVLKPEVSERVRNERAELSKILHAQAERMRRLP